MEIKDSETTVSKYRCILCAEYHEGDCDEHAKLAWLMDCAFDVLDDLAGEPPEPGGRRWLVERGEYPPDHLERLTELRDNEVTHANN